MLWYLPEGRGWVVEGVAMGIPCNPIWDGGDAPRKILTGINRETAAETGGNMKQQVNTRRETLITD